MSKKNPAMAIRQGPRFSRALHQLVDEMVRPANPAPAAGRDRLSVGWPEPLTEQEPIHPLASSEGPEGELAARPKSAIVAAMTAYDVIDQIKALPPEEKNKVVEFVQHEFEERLLSEESPALLAAIDEGIRSLEQGGGRQVNRAELEQKIRKWALGESS
ncbi:MAG: hypothetical protein ABIQ12_00740 [Opitutaceae bacterium]